jgi:dTDP-4-dehydrorhamnose 3,5-epimerase
MIFTETKLAGVLVLDPKRFEDERGFFAPAFSALEFESHGMAAHFVESNISYSRRRGTIRGMHYQAAPHGQAKLVRCTRGAVYDVVIDIRRDSRTYGQWFGVELTAESRRMIYLPADCAHGFQTLVDDAEVFYMVSSPYAPASGRGVRWDDPAFRVAWPDVDERVLIERDRSYQDFEL